MTDENLDQWSGEEMQELRRVFAAEAHELVDNLQDALLRLESDPEEEELLRSIKRFVHTLKGDSNSVGLTTVGALCHRMEDVLAGLMDGTIVIEHNVIDLLLSCVDTAQKCLAEFEAGRSGDSAEAIGRIDWFLANQGKTRPAEKPALTEYEQLQNRAAAQGGPVTLEVQAVFHPQCGEKSVAALMVQRNLEELGRIISIRPDPDDEAITGADRITIFLATHRDEEDIRAAALITGITSEAFVQASKSAGEALSSVEGETMQRGGRQENQQPERTAARQGEMLRIEAGRVDRIMNLTAELIIGRSMIEQVLRDIEAGVAVHDVAARLFAVNTYLDRSVTDLQKGVMKMRMVPVNHVFRKFPKMVRDLTAEKGKPVRLEIEGKETELDKGIVDALGEPLAHIIRNMVDHGIESPDRRSAAGKPAEGTISLRAYHEAAQIVIEAADDGGGIDTAKLRRIAAQKGFMTAAEAEKLSDAEARELIYRSGLSTADQVSETSGRGVGMDAVKAAVESLRGTIETESTPGKGSLFRLRLPLTLAVIRALLFQVADRLYAVPLSIIAEITKVMPAELSTVDGRETLVLRDRTVSLVRPERLFRLQSGGEGKKFALLLNISNGRVGVLVDRIMGQQELVIKSLDAEISRSELVAGASILGDGSVVMILDASAMVRKAVEQERKGPAES